METMKAIRIHSYGAEALIYEDTPRLAPQVGEVLVKVYAAGINGIDWKIRDGELQQVFKFELPIVLGSDAAEVVAAIGDGVTTFQVGQAVYGVATGYARKPARSVSKAHSIVVFLIQSSQNIKFQN